VTQLIKEVQEYLYKTLLIQIMPRHWKNKNKLPFFLLNSYDFYEIDLLESHSLLMINKENTEIRPSEIHNHWKIIQEKYPDECIYVQSVISSYNRQRLIDRNIPFIVPGNQMYLPHLGIDLREHFRKMHNRKTTHVSPATQLVIIDALIHTVNEPTSPRILANKFGYSLMTITRTFKELESLKIGQVLRKKRGCVWIVANKKTLWEQAKNFLQSPVKKRIWLQHRTLDIFSGLSALSHFSMISPPKLPIFAIGIDQWKQLEQLGVDLAPTSEDADCELEIWNYDPKLFTTTCFADSFSLYLSLQTYEDERVKIALEEMMEKIVW